MATLADLKDIFSIMGDTPEEEKLRDMNLQNAALRNMQLRRELSEPSSYEKDQEKQRIDFIKDTFTTLKDLALNSSLSEATRDNLYGLVEQQYFGLPREYQAILRPLLANTPLDENQKKLKFFEQQFGKGPEIPYYSGQGKPAKDMPQDGLLPQNEETEVTWANYVLRKQDYEYQKTLFLFGKETADANKPPQYVKILPDVQEPGKTVDGKTAEGTIKYSDFWTIDRRTNTVKRVPKVLSDTDIKQATEWGYSETTMLEKNFAPLAEPMSGVNQGQYFRVTQGRDLQGRPKVDLETYGNKAPAQEQLAPWLAAFGILASGKGVDEAKDGTVKGIVAKLSELTDKRLTPQEFQRGLANLNVWMKTQQPNMPYVLTYLKEEDEHSVWSKNLIVIDGQNFGFIPATETREYLDSQGKQFTAYWSSYTGQTTDGVGRDLTEKVKGIQPGTIVPTVTLNPTATTQPTKEKGFIEKNIRTPSEQGLTETPILKESKDIFNDPLGMEMYNKYLDPLIAAIANQDRASIEAIKRVTHPNLFNALYKEALAELRKIRQQGGERR